MEGGYSDVMESCIGQQCSRHNFFMLIINTGYNRAQMVVVIVACLRREARKHF